MLSITCYNGLANLNCWHLDSSCIGIYLEAFQLGNKLVADKHKWVHRLLFCCVYNINILRNLRFRHISSFAIFAEQSPPQVLSKKKTRQTCFASTRQVFQGNRIGFQHFRLTPFWWFEFYSIGTLEFKAGTQK